MKIYSFIYFTKEKIRKSRFRMRRIKKYEMRKELLFSEKEIYGKRGKEREEKKELSKLYDR